MNSHTWIVTLAAVCIVISGCRREDPQPELSDYIYIDLKNEVQAGERNVEEFKKKLASAEESFRISAARTIDRRTAKDEITKYTDALNRASEQLEYYKIRLSRRYAETRYNYRVAFREGRAWPPEKEFEYYQVQKKLANAPKAWSAHLISEADAKTSKPSTSTTAGN